MPRLLHAFVLASVGLLALSTAACNRVVVDDVHGPDGADWKRISCKRMDKRCFKAAQEMCPNGYYFAKASGPGPEVIAAAHKHDDDDARDPTVVPSSKGPAPGANVKTLPPQEKWDDEMYTRKGGTILVKCADTKATASR